MTRPNRFSTRIAACTSHKRLLAAAVAAFGVTLSLPDAHAQAGIDPLDFSKLFDPLEGAILSHDYENIRVPEAPERICTQQEKDALRAQMIAAKNICGRLCGTGGADPAVLLETEIPGP